VLADLPWTENVLFCSSNPTLLVRVIIFRRVPGEVVCLDPSGNVRAPPELIVTFPAVILPVSVRLLIDVLAIPEAN
jgi:hypothetical protein